jgi:hypothetical protein
MYRLTEAAVLWRVNRAQVIGRGSGVSCTASLGGTWQRVSGAAGGERFTPRRALCPTDCGVEREQPEPRRRGGTSRARRRREHHEP